MLDISNQGAFILKDTLDKEDISSNHSEGMIARSKSLDLVANLYIRSLLYVFKLL